MTKCVCTEESELEIVASAELLTLAFEVYSVALTGCHSYLTKASLSALTALSLSLALFSSSAISKHSDLPSAVFSPRVLAAA